MSRFYAFLEVWARDARVSLWFWASRWVPIIDKISDGNIWVGGLGSDIVTDGSSVTAEGIGDTNGSAEQVVSTPYVVDVSGCS